MTQNGSQPATGTSQAWSSYGTPWEEYDLHQGGYGKYQMFRPQQFPRQWPSSPGSPRATLVLPRNNPVRQRTSSSSIPPTRPPSSAPGRQLVNLLTKRFQLRWKPWTTEVGRIADFAPLPGISYDANDGDDESDDLFDSGSAEGQPPISLE